MGDVLKQCALDVPYCTGPMAWTDLHAGGIFFYVVYRECLQFSAGGRARRWCEVIDGSRPLDDEIERLQADDTTGSYRLSGRGYIECEFPGLLLTGLPCDQAPEILAFNAFRAGKGVSTSLVYTRSASQAEPGAAADRGNGDGLPWR